MYEARDEAARERIRQMVRQGKDPEYMHNFDREVSAYQDRSGNMYAIRDEVAREKIRILIQQGKDPEMPWNSDRDISDYQDRCNKLNFSSKTSQTTYNSSYTSDEQKIHDTLHALLKKRRLSLNLTASEQAWHDKCQQRFKLMDESITCAYLARTAPTVDFTDENDELCKQIILELEKFWSVNCSSSDLEKLNACLKNIREFLQISGNPSWFRSKLSELETKVKDKICAEVSIDMKHKSSAPLSENEIKLLTNAPDESKNRCTMNPNYFKKKFWM